jgi:dihydroorotate dehydrogenase electron transfer subunit
MPEGPHRGTIFVEQASVLSHQAMLGAQHVLRLHAPRCAAKAIPGSFAHLQCHPLLAMRRPLSIMRAAAQDGWVEFLYKAVGHGTRLLADRLPGETLSLMGPIGRGFSPDPRRPHALLIGGGVGIPPMVFLADALRSMAPRPQPFVIMGSEVPFPFAPVDSRLEVAGMPNAVSAAAPLLEDWGVPSRLASLRECAGCYAGYVTGLARLWLDARGPTSRHDVAVYACGPEPMLRAVAALAWEYELPCQLSLEEYMACAVGGCAGCTVPVHEQGSVFMRRVCVDGPVFDARTVYPAAA